MKFGVREICDVVLRAKANQKIGNKIFYKNEPVIYFDTLRTSTLEGAATTVYAQGGRGNTRLIAWEGERTVTFTMEDALISPIGFSILSGAGVVDATDTAPIYQHVTEQTDVFTYDEGVSLKITLEDAPAVYVDDSTTPGLRSNEDYIYVMPVDENGDIESEPFIAKVDDSDDTGKTIIITVAEAEITGRQYTAADLDAAFKNTFAVLVDYYVARKSNGQQIEITADKFGGNYYLEASTLFRNTAGVDMPAEFIIPNCKIQSNFTFTMASSGDPSTFTFTMDAFPDYTRFDSSKKVLAAVQIFSDSTGEDELRRIDTYSTDIENSNGIIERPDEAGG